MSESETLSLRAARRLALARAGLWNSASCGWPASARGAGLRARRAALELVERFGYLQLDTVSIAGARSHALVLLSRFEGLAPALGEELLKPGEPLFEYWGHEASWLPLDLYPAFEFRRRAFAHHPWWGDVVGAHPDVTQRLRERIHAEGPLRSIDMEGRGGRGWWDLKAAKKVATALWSSGELAIVERTSFQRSFDLAERVIPESLRSAPLAKDEAFESLLARALAGHGWATTGTLAATWRLRNEKATIERALARLVERGEIVACALVDAEGRRTPGWIRPPDLELAARLERARPRPDRGVLLSPFDPLLWDRGRVKKLFDFDQVLEIFKPAPQRVYGYYCLPVLAGESLVARYDLKADRQRGTLHVLACWFERGGGAAGPPRTRPPTATVGAAARTALERHATALELEVTGPRR